MLHYIRIIITLYYMIAYPLRHELAVVLLALLPDLHQGLHAVGEHLAGLLDTMINILQFTMMCYTVMLYDITYNTVQYDNLIS